MCRLAHFNSYLKFFGVEIRFFSNYKEVKKLKFYPRNSKKRENLKNLFSLKNYYEIVVSLSNKKDMT